MTNEYFANVAQEDIAPELYKRVTDFYDEVDRNGRLELWRKAHRYYFALGLYGRHEGQEIHRTGEEGHLSVLKANHYRNLLQHLHVLVTQQRPSFDCRAINSDYKSQIQTILGRNVLEYYMREKRLATQMRYAAESAIAYAEAYVEIEWDHLAGDQIAADTESGEILTTGDVAVRVYEPIDVIRRTKCTAEGRQSWYILRRWEPRHDLAAKYSEFSEQILAYSADMADNRYYFDVQANTTAEDEDLVPVYVFYHDATPACPTGRRVKFLGPDVCLEYATLDYPDLPVYPMIPSRQHGTTFGYSVGFDLLCVQEAIDRLYSTILTNQDTFGVQNIWLKPGSNLAATQLAGGLNVLESNEQPVPINLTHTPQEIFNFLKGLEQLGEVLSGVNGVARGQPEASLKSGTALALVASQAVQFSNSLASAYTQLLEDTGTAILRILQTRAALPRTALIAGKDNKSYMKEFTGDDLKSISRVYVDVGNPLSNTLAGRTDMAEKLLQSGLIKRPEQYITVIETGRIEPMIDDERAESLLIESENEALREGRPVISTAVDQHLEHIKGHRAVLADPDIRLQGPLVQRTLAHIQEHIMALRTTDPGLLNALGQAPMAPGPNGAPPPPQGANAPQPPQNQPSPPPPDQGPPQPGQKMPAPPNTPPEIAANMPKLPSPAPGAPLPPPPGK